MKTSISLSQACRYWAKLGLISFGGPAGQIALMHQELVDKRKWISEKQFLHALNFCMLLPGPEAQQLATYIGWLLHGRWGGIIAGTLFVLPAFILMLVLGYSYMMFGSLPVAQAILWGIKPAVVALVAFAALRIAKKTLHHRSLFLIAAMALISVAVFNISFPIVIFFAGLIGWLLRHQIEPQDSANSPMLKSSSHSSSHAWLSVGIIGLAIFAVGITSLLVIFGQHHVLTSMAWFFTKSALLTFGGAYAVLPYISHALVDQYQWLTPAQMIDGLALGETTPGPLIMVISFVSFVAGWNQHIFGTDALLASALAASAVATFFTFLPSFVMVLMGAPLIEASHQQLHLKAPLTGISAAVVGVIINLAIFFASHVFWHEHRLDYWSLALAIVAFIVLQKQKASPLVVILACALIGAITSWV
jgi:chromate transporter